MEFQNIVEEEMYENILLNLINDDDVPVPNVIPPNLLEIVREENGDRRRVIPRNEDFYEEVIPRYFEDLFVEHFRMSRAVFQQLLELVGNQSMVSENALIPLEKKLLFTVWMLAKPECFLAAGDRFGLSKGTGHFIFKEIVAILKHLRFQLILWPNNHENSMRVFNERSNGFSGVVGAIDGCHIPIKQPANNGHDYYNRKQFHSIILQGVCDHQMLFFDINVGMPGREEVNVQEDDEENIVFDNVENERIEEENEAVLKRNHFVNIFRNN
uniref:Nuclease HARBI1 n=1 Tax=Diabrotica virgifera virgifera TaxID=50390 RepID=A0A6P7H3V0_DIAVI